MTPVLLIVCMLLSMELPIPIYKPVVYTTMASSGRDKLPLLLAAFTVADFGLSFLLHGSFPLNFCLTEPRPPRTRPACPYLPGDTAATRSSIRHSFILLYYYCALITLLTFCLTFAAGPVDVALPCTPRLFPLRLPFPLRLAICFLHMFPTLS